MKEKQTDDLQVDNYKSKITKRILPIAIMVAAAVVAVIAVYNIVQIQSQSAEGKEIYHIIRTEADESTTYDGTIETSGMREIDFDALNRINEDTVAWISIPGTDIDYPVVQADNNDYYLTRSADKTMNSSGAIFMDMNNSASFSDKSTLIYGHNMNDGSMFAGLHDYEKQDFYDQHPYFYIYTPDGTYRKYHIFAALQIEDGPDYYPISFSSDKDFENYIALLEKGTPISTGVTVEGGGSTITLSTCVKGNDTARYIIVGVLEEEGAV